MPREKTIHVGVYVRSVKNRIGPSGELDKCFDIHYKLNGKDIWERVGWESEGFTAEDAVAIRKKRIEELRRPVSGSYKSGRVKTKYVGVYVRQARNRLDAAGKPDKGYDIHYKHNGKDIWERVGWKSEGYSVQDAIAVRAQRIRSIRHPELAAVDAGITLLQLWIKYAETWLPQQKSADNSISVINKHLISHLGNIPVNKITPLDVEILKNKLLKDLKPGTVKLILKKLRAIINKGKEWNLVKKELIFPRTCFNVPNAEVKRDKYLEPKEAERILDGLQFYDCMLYYIAKFALYTGMRLGEIVNLKSKDINIEAKLIYVDGKTGHRVAYIPDEILGDIQKLMNNDGEKNIFEIYRGRKTSTALVSMKFAAFMRMTGFNEGIEDSTKKIVFHTFRHTFCSWLAIAGVPLFTIGQLVGHSSTKMTERYAKLSPDSKRDALEKIHATLNQARRES